MQDGKIAAILISAPAAIPEGKVTIPAALQAKEYSVVSLDGSKQVSFNGNVLDIPAFEGMLMIVAQN